MRCGDLREGSRQYLLRHTRSSAEPPWSPTTADSAQARSKRSSRVRNVRSGLWPTTGSPSARVMRAVRRGVSCTSSSGRAVPVLVSRRALTSSCVTPEMARLSPVTAVSPATPIAADVHSLALPGVPLAPNEPSGVPNNKRLTTLSALSGGSERNFSLPSLAVPV